MLSCKGHQLSSTFAVPGLLGCKNGHFQHSCPLPYPPPPLHGWGPTNGNTKKSRRYFSLHNNDYFIHSYQIFISTSGSALSYRRYTISKLQVFSWPEGQFKKTFTNVIYLCSFCFQTIKQWLHLLKFYWIDSWLHFHFLQQLQKGRNNTRTGLAHLHT